MMFVLLVSGLGREEWEKGEDKVGERSWVDFKIRFLFQGVC